MCEYSGPDPGEENRDLSADPQEEYSKFTQAKGCSTEQNTLLTKLLFVN